MKEARKRSEKRQIRVDKVRQAKAKGMPNALL